MKPFYSLIASAMFFGASAQLASAGVHVSVDFFHDNLESYGDWREVGDYGYCWQPRDVGPDFRPYSDGRWVYTDAGWTWTSEEPYSWAVYHYGRWARVERVGWVWVPGTEWAPAWVSWRRSPRHVGWAPLPPDARFERSSGFSSRVDVDYDIGPTNYNFVEVRNFGAPRLRTVLVQPAQNLTIIRQTTNITRITYENNVVYNGGPQYEAISRESSQPIQRLRLERREALDGDPRAIGADQLRARVEGDSLRVLTLPVDTAQASAPKKVAARIERAEVDRGWKNAGPKEEVEKLRAKIKEEPASAPAGTAAAPAVQLGEQKVAPPGTAETPVSKGGGKPGREAKGGQPFYPPAPAPTDTQPVSGEKLAVPDTQAVPAQPAPLPKGGKLPKVKGNKGKGGAVPAERTTPAQTPAPADTPAPAERPAPAEKPEMPKASKKNKNRPDQPPRTVAEPQPGEQVPAAERTTPAQTPAPAERPAPAEKPEMPKASKKNKNRPDQPPRTAAEPQPGDEVPAARPQHPEKQDRPPAAGLDAARQKNREPKNEARPAPEPAAPRSVEHKAPKAPEARPQPQRPEARPPVAPAAAMPQKHDKEKGKGKGKGKDDKTEEAPR